MSLTITEVEVIAVYPKLAGRYAHRLMDYYTIDHRDFFKVSTSTGVVGWGENRARPQSHIAPGSFEHLIGMSPFEAVHLAGLNAGVVTALFDVMGKHLDLPVHALLGRKVREWVPCCAWTRPASPSDFADEIVRAAVEGYSTFKMHSASHFDVLEQIRAARAVAPPGFKLHLDFNHNRTLASVLPLLQELQEEHRDLVGFIEDPVVYEDLESWCAIRSQFTIPIVMQVSGMFPLISQESFHAQRIMHAG
jgi:galactonate dehydratase